MSSDLGAKPDSEKKSEVCDMPKLEGTKNTETKENVNLETVDTMPDSEKSNTLPEAVHAGKDMPRLPPIGMAELTSILQGPNMPSQKLMKEVTEKIRMRNDESGSDDGSVSGSGAVGIRGILDCLVEVTLFHQDSEDDSEGEGDEIFIRELPCRFCKKIFKSTMKLKTHVLMTHSQDDPSVLNVKNLSRDGGRKEKLSPLGRSKSIEAREKESLARSRKRSSAAAQQDSSASKQETSVREKKVRSRHTSKEQELTKVTDKIEGKPNESSTLSPAISVDSSKSTTISSRQIRQISQEKDNAKKCESSVVDPAKAPKELVHTQQEDNTPSSSKATKRKSSKVSSTISDSSTSKKKAKRSQSQSGEAKESSGQLRRSSRRK